VSPTSQPIGPLPCRNCREYFDKNPKKFVHVDFVVLDMQEDMKTTLILGRPFLSITNAHIDVGAKEIKFNIDGKEERFAFKPRPEQCSNLECHEKQVSRSPSLGLKDTPED
jgi:hypothetical protein